MPLLGDGRGCRRPFLILAALTLLVLAGGLGAVLVWHARRSGDPIGTSRATGGAANGIPPSVISKRSRRVRHFEYVFPDEHMYVYDIDRRHRLVEKRAFPGLKGIRGVAASPATHMLYVSHGGDGGSNGSGSLMKYDLVARRIVWDKALGSGIDSMGLSRDGSRLYMPTGELSSSGVWNVLDAGDGRVRGRIQGGAGPHNTIVSLGGGHVYLGGRDHQYLEVARTATNRVTKRIGPLKSGVRPFTTNRRETLAYTTATGFLGFQVSDIGTGRVLHTVTFGRRFRWDPSSFEPTAPSHGISLSPNERQIWVIDAPNSYVHVFDVGGVRKRSPRRIADIKLRHTLSGSESPCTYDCARDGWLQHSRDGRFVYVGDSGEVISTSKLKQVAYLRALRNTRKHLEIDWRGGVPVATTTRSGLGYARAGARRGPP
jgi:hypothetical protein